MAGDFNLNLLYQDASKKKQNFLNLVYQNGMSLTINKSTRVIKKLQRQLITFSQVVLLKQSLKLLILKVIYPIIFLFFSWFHRPQHKNEIKQILFAKKIFNAESIESFKKKIYETDLEENESSKNPEDLIIIFLKMIKLKPKDLKSPRITRGIKKSSKQKQGLCDKFLKKRTDKNQLEYKNYK